MRFCFYILIDKSLRVYYTGSTYNQVNIYKKNNNINAQIIEMEGNLE